MRFLFLSLFTLTLSLAQAQDKPFEYNLGWKGGGSLNPIQVKSISDSSGDLTCVLAKNSSQMKGFLFDKNMKFLKTFTTSAIEEAFLGGFIKDSVAHVFLRAEFVDEVHVININLRDGTSENFITPFVLKGEKKIGSINSGDAFLYITAEKKEPVLNVYKFTGVATAEKISFDLSKEELKTNFAKRELWDALSSPSSLSRSVDVAIVDPDIECEAEVADSPNKLYLRKNSLLLFLDRDPEQLKIFDLNLQTKSASYRIIKRGFPPIAVDAFDKPKFNSFLLDDKLYFVHATASDLSTCIYNFDSGKLLSNYHATADGQIDFKNTPVIQEGGGTIYSKNVERELVKTKQLLRKMMAGNALITAVKNASNQHEVTIGAYKKITQTSGGYVMGGGFGPAGFAGGTATYFTTGISSSWSRVTRFKMLVDPVSAKQIGGEMQQSKSEEIQDYSQDLRIPEKGSSVFVANNFYQFAYYDRDEKKLVVVKF